MTLSMTWITPLEATTSVATMLASLIMGLPSTIVKATAGPARVGALRPSVTSAAITLPASTW